MTTGENFTKKRKCKNKHCSAMSSSAWCDLNSRGDVLKLHDLCHNPKCKCQKPITFTPKQFQLEGAGFEKTRKKIKGTVKLWRNFIKPGLKALTPCLSAGIAAKTKNLQSAQITTNILKSIIGGKILSLTDMHGNGLRLRVM